MNQRQLRIFEGKRMRCEKCFITYDELLEDKEHEEALWMCLTHYCFNCCPKDIADKIKNAIHKTVTKVIN